VVDLITALIANRTGADHEAQRPRTQGYPSVSINSVFDEVERLFSRERRRVEGRDAEGVVYVSFEKFSPPRLAAWWISWTIGGCLFFSLAGSRLSW
jgi:hypothetical protein